MSLARPTIFTSVHAPIDNAAVYTDFLSIEIGCSSVTIRCDTPEDAAELAEAINAVRNRQRARAASPLLAEAA